MKISVIPIFGTQQTFKMFSFMHLVSLKMQKTLEYSFLQEYKQSVRFSSVAQSCPTLCDPMDCSKPGFPVSHYLSEFAQVHVHWIGEAIQPSHPLLPSSPSAFNLSSIRVFSNESAVGIRWPKYWSFSISPSKEYSGLISFRIDWFDLLAVQGILKSLRQHHSLKALILRHSTFFMVQLSHLYMTTGKIALCV